MKKILKKSLLIIMISLTIISCDNTTKEKIQRPILLNQKEIKTPPQNILYKKLNLNKNKNEKIKLEKIKKEKELEIAKLNNEKDIKIAKLNAKTKELEIRVNKEINKEKNKLNIIQSEKNIKTEQMKIISITIILLLSIITFIIVSNNNRKTKIKIEENKLNQEKELREKEMQINIATKLIETIGQDNTNEAVKHQLLSYLNKNTNILEYKK